MTPSDPMTPSYPMTPSGPASSPIEASPGHPPNQSLVGIACTPAPPPDPN